MSLGSGSSGNCYYLGTDSYGILIDAGIAVRTMRKSLKEVGIGMDSIRAVFVTHDHADHIKSVGTLGEKCFIPIYATEKTHQGIHRSYCVTEKLNGSVRYIEKQCPMQLLDFTVEAFEVPHDGTDNVGYCITMAEKTFCFVTDLGEITPVIASYVRKANYLVIESNYDEEMLRMGPYPEYLKARITSGVGHLSNQAISLFLSEHFENHLKHIWLCHLSKENNHPDLAYKTMELALAGRDILVGRDVQLTVLRRTLPTELYDLE